MTVGIVCDGGVSLPADLPGRVTVALLQRDRAGAGIERLAGVGDDAGPGTAAPAPGAFLEATEHTDDGSGVLVLRVATAFSASFDAARLAATSARA